jgi:beta-lactamase regulating signal transducer with metallopeptidase domain
MIESIDSGVLNAVFLCCQIFLIVAIAYAIHRLLSRRPGSQYFVWLIAVLSIGIAVPLQFQIPPVDVKLQATVSVAKAGASSANDSASKLIEPKAIESSKQTEAIDSKLAAAASSQPSEIQSVSSVSNEQLIPSEQFSSDEKSAIPLPAVLAPSGEPRWLPFSVYQLLAVIYFAVVTVLSLRLLAGFWMLHSIKRDGFKPDLSQATIKTTFESMDLKTAPQVLLSDATSTPMAFGIFKPVILMPKDFESWSKPAQRIALMHEASHVVRHDAIWDLASRVVSIAYWFHPAIHLATRFLRRTRERATDAMVLDHGISSTVYATQLLEIATRTLKSNHASALCMAFDGDVKDRINTILAARTSAKHSSKFALSMKLFVAAIFITLASVSLKLSFANSSFATDEEGLDAKKTKPAEVTGDTFFERVQCVEPKNYQTFSGTINAHGRVLDDKENPVGDAIVILRDASCSMMVGRGAINDVIAKTKTNYDGSYRFTDVVNPSYAERGLSCEVLALTRNQSGFQRLHVKPNHAETIAVPDVRVLNTVSVKATVVDADDRPISNARVYLRHISVPEGERDHQRFFMDRTINPPAETDSEGNFELKGLPSGVAVSLGIEHSDFALKRVIVRTTKSHPEFVQRDTMPYKVLENGATIVLEKGISLSGFVEDGNREPIVDAYVNWQGRRTRTSSSGAFRMLVTEKAVESSEEIELEITVGKEWQSQKVKVKGLRDGTAKIRVAKRATISGRVLASKTKKPIAGIIVWTNTGPERHCGSYTMTDENGNYSSNAVPGLVTISFETALQGIDLENAMVANGIRLERGGKPFAQYERAAGCIELKPGEKQKVDFLIPATPSVMVEVVDEKGRPVEGADVWLAFHDQFKDKSGSDGRVAFHVPAGTEKNRILFARHEVDGKVFWAKGGIEKGRQTNKLTLRPAVRLSGKISVEGNALSDIDVTIGMSLGNGPDYTVAVAKTDKDGIYSAFVPSGKQPFASPIYRVSCRRSEKVPNLKGAFGFAKPKFVDGELKADIDLINGRGKIAGIVVNESGDPVANARVDLHSLMMRKPERKELQARQLFGKTSQFTDAEGRFELDGLPGGYMAILMCSDSQQKESGTAMIDVGNTSARLLLVSKSGQQEMMSSLE